MRSFWKFLTVLAFIAGMDSAALADGTQAQVIPGYLTTTPQPNCPVGPCFVNSTPSVPIAGSAQYGLAITTSTALTVPVGATYAVVYAIGNAVNYTTDGTAASASGSQDLIAAGGHLVLQGPSVLAAFRAIQNTATATITVSYYK